MDKLSKESKQLLDTIKRYGPMRATDMIKILDVSTKTIYKHLSRLLDEQRIKKTGAIPKVFYSINTENEDSLVIIEKGDQLIEQNYIYVSPSGEILRGISGFYAWCRKNRFDVKKEKRLFIARLKSIQKLKKNGVISAKKTILSGKRTLYLDNIFFSDFYTFDHFGKTKLGQLVYLGKSSQNKELIAEIAGTVKPAIKNIIEKYNIKLICFIPPTIDRKIQFMDVFKKRLRLNLPEISATKVASATKIPQKTLRKLNDRIINAKATIAVSPSQKINSNILIIDDATGSGATLNETANKIRNIAKVKIKIIGYSVIGSYKGFDVIREV